MNDMRLVDITPIVNGWNDAVKEKLEEAEALMASGTLTDHNRGAVKEQVANLVSGLADDLMSAPVIDPETLRSTAHIIRGYVPETKDGVFCDGCQHPYPGRDADDCDRDETTGKCRFSHRCVVEGGQA